MKKYLHDTSHQIENFILYKYASIYVILINISSYPVFYSCIEDFQFNALKQFES